MEKLTGARRTVSNLSLGPDGHLTMLSGTATETPEVHALEAGRLRKLTKVNDALLAELQLGTTEDFASTSKDGTVVHSLIVKPASYVAGKKYPLLLYIHGGPNGQDQHSFSFDRELFAASGYVVLAVNYRGSDGRGAAFQRAIFADWGEQGSGRPAGRGGRGDRGRHRRSRAPRRRRLELRRHPDRLPSSRPTRASRRRSAAPAAPCSSRCTGTTSTSCSTRAGARPAVEDAGRLDEGVVPVLQGRPHQDADAVPVRREGLQRPDHRRRADVPGAQEPGRRHAAGHLPGPVPRTDDPELPARPSRSLPEVVGQSTSRSKAHQDGRDDQGDHAPGHLAGRLAGTRFTDSGARKLRPVRHFASQTAPEDPHSSRAGEGGSDPLSSGRGRSRRPSSGTLRGSLPPSPCRSGRPRDSERRPCRSTCQSACHSVCRSTCRAATTSRTRSICSCISSETGAGDW